MGLDDIERLLRTPEHVDLSPMELKSLVALLCDTGEETGDPRIMTIAATLHGSPVESAPLSEKRPSSCSSRSPLRTTTRTSNAAARPCHEPTTRWSFHIWPASRPTTGMRGAT